MPRLADVFTGIGRGVTTRLEEDRKAKQEQASKLEQIRYTAMMAELAKMLFPDAEEQSKQKALALIEEQTASPELRMGRNVDTTFRGLMSGRTAISPLEERLLRAKDYGGQITTPADRTRRMQGALETQRQTNAQRRLEMLQGIIGKGAGTGVNVAVFDPSTGQTYPSPGGQGLGPRTRVMPLRTSPEEAEDLAQSRARGATLARQRVKYEDLLLQYDFIVDDVDSVLGFLDTIPAGRFQGPAAMVNALAGGPGSEDVLSYIRTKDLILSKIAKTFGGEVGVLTEQDIRRIGKAFPALWMNETERAQQVAWIKDYIKRRLDAYQSASQRLQEGRADFSGTATTKTSGADADFIAQLEAQGFTVEAIE